MRAANSPQQYCTLSLYINQHQNSAHRYQERNLGHPLFIETIIAPALFYNVHLRLQIFIVENYLRKTEIAVTILRLQPDNLSRFLPYLETLQQLNMLCGHSPDRTKMLRVQEFHKEHLRHHVRASSSEMFKPAPKAPVVDGSFAVASEIRNLPHRQHIRISVQAAYVVFGHVLVSHRQRHLARARVPFSVPADGCHIPLWEDGSLLQIFFYVCLSDLIAACLLSAVLAGHPAAAQKL